jgi:hypothetical protein
MFSLNDTDRALIPFCRRLLASRGVADPSAPASSLTAQLGQQYAGVSESALDQCLVEQRYVRGAQLRTLIYCQVGLLAVRVATLLQLCCQGLACYCKLLHSCAQSSTARWVMNGGAGRWGGAACLGVCVRADSWSCHSIFVLLAPVFYRCSHH